MHLIQFRLAFAEGDLVAAAEEVFRLEKIGLLICSGEGQMLHYLIGLWLRAAAIRGFGHVATNIHAPAAVLEQILETIEQGLKSPDGMAQSLRVDLSSVALAQLDRTIDGGKLPQIVDSLLEVYYRPRLGIDAKAPGSEHAAIAEAWLDDLRELLLLLLDGHPRPFDKKATARLMGTITAETIGDLEFVRRPAFLDIAGQLQGLRRKLRLHRLSQRTRYWPVELSPGAHVEITAGMGLKPPVDEEVIAIELPSDSLVNPRLVKLSGSKLRRVDNPVGLMLTKQRLVFDYGPHLLNHLNTMKTMRRLMKQRLAAKGTIHVDD